ncbi:uncharacterized membrane protein YidH (DUF202 family) [Allocatelliglobosispora scoriae]|uniref:Uncharacterized membrane protein YidH (DUF202 family) n=1 Tax=Allocatelliglobosispora scoriae TaxID=643052 RepID=A0A841C2H0_9ACTN|nr:hypothetical protein [Allocatelliglobosispora scoriae]MBB5873333.1 uncharacterized membrane protein YidH (DUF202 family) [Allocatelliglobosispora scoriae]
MIDSPLLRSRWLRVLLGLVAIGVGIAGAVWFDDLSHEIDLLRAVRRQVRDDGFAIIAFFLVTVLVGTLLQVVPAAAAGASIRHGLRTTATLLGYGVLVAGLAWFLAPLSPELSSNSRRFDPGALYTTWLTCVLLSFGVLACFGGQFSRPAADPEPAILQRRLSPEERRAADPAAPLGPVNAAVFATAAIGWLIGGICLLVLLVIALIRLIGG